MEQFDAIIYDMDGLIIDSEPFWRQVEMKVFASVGLNITEKDCAELTGFRFDEVVEYWWRKSPWTGKSKEQVHDEVLDEMENAITHQAQAMRGVHASLDFFKTQNVKMAVASSSAMRLIKATVKKLKIESYFDLLVSAEHETHGKPNPAVFIRTADTLQVRPEKCLVIEDSFNGLLAAKAARMKCLMVPYPEGFNNPKLIIADWKIKSLEAIPELFKA
jgi:HAD superfamily hydrolase (TIGR01509 family)